MKSPRRAVCYLILIVSGLFSVPLYSQSQVEVIGLFNGSAILKIDGEQKLLREGKHYKGISLIEADSRGALIEVNGTQRKVWLSKAIHTSYITAKKQRVSIPVNGNKQYITNALINGTRIPVLVDTGANIIALNSSQAKQLNIDYSKGAASIVTTASGQEQAITVLLNRVEVGGIAINHVQASIIEGDYPEIVLLGMSFLQHVEMQESNGQLHLIQKY